MGHTFDSMLKEATELPWAMGARLMVELRSSVKIPDKPVMTKEAALGLVKIARIIKMAETPEEAQQVLQQQAMTDPNIVQAMDYQQAQNEREMLMAKVQELQVATEAAQAQAMQADQVAQAASQQQEQLTAAAQQAKQEQVNAVMESMQAKDQVLQTQVSAQQHRQQIAGFAQQMADQLKQIASTSPEEQQMQQEQAAAEQQQAMMNQQAVEQQAQGQPPAKSKTKKETEEAQTAQQKSQEQAAQAQQAQMEEQQQAAMMQQQQGAAPPGGAPPGMPGEVPKMGSARLRKIAAQLRAAHLRKRAFDELTPAQKITETPPNEEEEEEEEGEGDLEEVLEHIVELRSRLVDQGLSPADIDHYIRLVEEGEEDKAEDFAEEAIEGEEDELPKKVAALRFVKIASLVKRAQFSQTNPGYGVGSEGSGQQGMFVQAALGEPSKDQKAWRETREAFRAARAKSREKRQREMAGLGPMAKSSQGFATSNSGLGEDQGGIGAQGGMNQYASMGGVGKMASGLQQLKDVWKVGRLNRTLKEVAKATGERFVKDPAIRKLPVSSRAVAHLGEHAEKYLAGGALAGTAAGSAAIGHAVGKRKHGSARVMALIEKLANDQKAREVGEALGVNWDQVDFTPNDFARGMEIEKEHHRSGVDIIPDEEMDLMTGKIALAHLREGGDYYDRLENMEAAMEADKDSSSASKEKQGSFSRGRAAQIAQRVLMAKTGSSKKAGRGSAQDAGSRLAQLEKDAGNAGLGTTAGYAALGATIGGGLEKMRLHAHAKKMGLDKPTDKEIELIGKFQAAKDLAKRDPSYTNKLRARNLDYKIDMERLSREHPDRAALRGAAWGTAAGASLGPLAHRLITKIVKKGR